MNKKTNNTAFIIRMHFAENDPRWIWRYAYFASMVLPKLLTQDNQDFDICIRANPWHADCLRALSEKIKVFDVAPAKKDFIKDGYLEKSKVYFIDFVDFKDTRGLDKYPIQIGIDSDDMILREDFVTRIKSEVAKRPDKSLHISFQPYIFHAPTLRNYRCNFHYGPEKGSPVFVLYQPKKTDFMYAYEDSHLKLPSYMQQAIRINEGYCSYTVHDFNSSTRLNRNARQTYI